MTPRMTLAALCTAILTLAGGVQAQQHDPATPIAVASKVALRGEANNIAVREIRIVRKNDVLVVQADLANMGRSDRTVFYRFKWHEETFPTPPRLEPGRGHAAAGRLPESFVPRDPL